MKLKNLESQSRHSRKEAGNSGLALRHLSDNYETMKAHNAHSLDRKTLLNQSSVDPQDPSYMKVAAQDDHSDRFKVLGEWSQSS